MPTPHFQTPAGSGYNTPARQFSVEKFGPLNMKPIDPFMPPYAAGLCLGRMEGEDEEEYVVMVSLYPWIMDDRRKQTANTIFHLA